MINSSNPLFPPNSNALTFTQVVFPQHSEEYLQLEALIRENDIHAVLNYDRDVPEAQSRARLYLAHMVAHPDAVLALLLFDAEGAQMAWEATREQENTRETLARLLPDAGWRDNGTHLVRTTAYHEEMQALAARLENPDETIVSGSTKRGTPEQRYLHRAEGGDRGIDSQGSPRSNGSLSANTLSSVSGGLNGRMPHLIASFLSQGSRATWLERLRSGSQVGSSESSPEESHRTSNRAVMDRTVCSTEVNPKKSDGPTRLPLLSARENNTEKFVAQSDDLNNSQVALQANDQVVQANGVLIHRDPRSFLHVAQANGSQRPNWCVRCCSFLANLFRRA